MQGLIRSIKRRFGISAPRMTVRTQLAWYWRWLLVVLVGGLTLVIAAWMYDAGRRFAGFDSSQVQDELAQLRASAARLEAENAKLRSLTDAADAKLRMEQSAQVQLVAQLKQFELENVRLKEDLAFFEGLIPNGQRGERLSIHRFTVQQAQQAGEYRYRLLLMQGGRRDQSFQGRIQLLGEVQEKGRNAMIPLTGEGLTDTGFQSLNFRFFHRVEGTFRLSPSARMRSIHVKVFENGVGEARAAQSANLP